ncbi:hypothetical protein DXH95_14285 [Sphingorhabdus pulchriflava]|uniref:Uncharacterized protein n=1 Tax=Sphingorhabdus pulchriflava TaxID=2292257 RepID=A0A371B2S1_9SPHN|nr:hypothetical protein DXH95_14285 [Sphingorhabdus pulchriflava]
MRLARRCGAKTRNGGFCATPAVKGRARCRMHGGAVGSGAPMDNQNALKKGLYTAKAIAERREIAALIRESQAFLKSLREKQ